MTKHEIMHGGLTFLWRPVHAHHNNARLWLCWALRYPDGSYELPMRNKLGKSNFSLYWRDRLGLYYCPLGYHDWRHRYTIFDSCIGASSRDSQMGNSKVRGG